MRHKSITSLAVLLVSLITVSLGLVACGSSDSTQTGGTSGKETNRSEAIDYHKQLEQAYEGTYELPTGGPVNPPKGKNIWVVSVGQSVEATQIDTAAMREASGALGWTVHVFDGEFEPSRYLTGVEQAIAAKADGIILLVVDCKLVKSGVEQAVAAGIPVVGAQAQDCKPGLFTYNLEFAGNADYREWLADDFGGIQAKWLVGKTNGQAKTIVTEETDADAAIVTYEGIVDVYDECPGCEIVDTVTFVGTEFGPPLQEKIEQSLIQHPEANSFIAAYDAVMTGGGGAAALRGSGRLNEILAMGGEGSAPAIDLIYQESGLDACSGLSLDWEGYGSIMGLARIFAGQDPYRGNSGLGAQACDREHNLPAKGETYQPPFDFRTAYRKLWGLED